MLGIPAYWWLDHSDPGVDRDSLTIGWWRLTETRWVTTGERGASSFFPTDGDPIKAAKIIVDLASYDELPERIQLAPTPTTTSRQSCNARQRPGAVAVDQPVDGLRRELAVVTSPGGRIRPG